MTVRPPKTWRPKTAMVLAAGLGKRMRPLTDRLPKPLVQLGGRPLLDHVLDRLADAGVARAVINVHYLADRIERHVAERRQPAIVISDERDRLLDTGGGIARALPLIGGDAFLVHNSDSVWIEGIGANLERLFAAWDPERMDCLMLVALGASSVGYEGLGDFRMHPDGRLERRPERQHAPFVFTGVSIMQPRLFEGHDPGAFSLNAVWDRAIAAGRLFGVRLDGTWMHVGTPDALADAERRLENVERY